MVWRLNILIETLWKCYKETSFERNFSTQTHYIEYDEPNFSAWSFKKWILFFKLFFEEIYNFRCEILFAKQINN